MIFRTDSDIVNTKISSRYLQLEQEISQYSSSISKDYLETIRRQKENLLQLVADRKNVIDDAVLRLKEQIRSSRKNLSDLYATNDLATDSEDLSNPYLTSCRNFS
jgi:gas vesicle protein